MIDINLTAPARILCQLASIPTQQPPFVDLFEGTLAWEAAHYKATELELCDSCGLDAHYVTVRIYPRPDPARLDAIDDVIECCSCCAFGDVGHPERGFLSRLRGEQAEGDDHDLTVEVMNADGLWIA